MIQFMLLTAAVVSAVLAGVVLANNPMRPVNKVYFLLSLAASLWFSANALVIDGPLTPSTTGLYLFIGRLITPSSILVAYFFVLFLFFLVRKSPARYRQRLSLLALPGFAIICLSFTGLNVTLDASGSLQLGVLSLPFVIVILGYLLASLYILFFKLPRRRDRAFVTQISYLRWAFFLAVMPTVLFGAVLPLFTKSSVINLGPLFSIIFLLCAAWLIIRHRLFDVRAIVAKVLAYALLLSTTVAFFVLLGILVSRYILQFTDAFIPSEAIPFTLAILVAFLLEPLKRFFDRLTNRLFYQDAYDPQLFLDELNTTIVISIEIDQLLAGVRDVIEKNIKASYVAFIIPATAHGIKRISESTRGIVHDNKLEDVLSATEHAPERIVYEADLGDKEEFNALHKRFLAGHVGIVAKMTTVSDGNIVSLGGLILGDKKSGNPYNSQDRRIMDIIVSELVIAIQNSLRFEEIRGFNETLQDKVEDATKRLRQTNDKLRALDQTKDDFISMASHQLRTPLTSIKGYVSMVLDGDAGPITPQQNKMLNQAFISSQRMVYLISDLLNVSRLKTGKFIIEPVQTNLAKVIQDEVEQLQETAKGRNLTLTYNKPAHFPTLMLDETKLRQVIMNFMDNAIYYTPAGGNITVNLVDKPLSVEFTVVDDGIGVPKHEQHHLFSKFYRAHNAKRARPDGTGLGLFMAKKVIVAQGGAIIFRSKEKQGSTFGFTFAKAKVMTAPEKQIAVKHDD